MATMLFVGTNGSEDPTKSVLPFLGANGAIEAGHAPQIALLGDAVVLVKGVVADNVHPVGWPPLAELIDAVVKNEVPIHV